IGTPMKDYQYKIGSMWAEDTKDVENGTFDVDDFVTGFIQTKNGPTISFNGAWAQNIFEDDRYIDFLGTKAGVRLQYCGNYKLYYYKDNEKVTVDGEEKETLPIHTEEVYDFIDAVINKKPVRNDISDLMNTAKLLQAIYDSSDSGKEIVF
ncbi:MAG: gfo/Idh/MocA family oxidoreductase, partial [Clostridia bacterium]|nr:gfo/Idh/MocA family oxidoreductase [Clostridia bacterium]